MEPRIQYTRTTDGVNIAYWSAGEGPPVLHLPPLPWSHLEDELRDPGYRGWFDALLSRVQLVRYDNRGSGLSDREVADVSPEAFLLDIDAVADKLGLEQFVLVGVSPSSPLALAYAARRPERVSKLIIWIAQIQWLDESTGNALQSLLDRDFNLYTQTVAHALVAGWGAGQPAAGFGQLMRDAIEAEPCRRIISAWSGFSAQPYLSQIGCPTLVIHRRDLLFPPVSEARAVAAQIPNAELALLDGSAHLPWVGDMVAVLRTTAQFLGLPAPHPTATAPAAPSAGAGLATILFTDVEGSTALTQRLGDAGAREVMRQHEQITRQALTAHGGAEVKTMGDGFMASFTSASRALECAIALQRAFDKWNTGVGAQQLPRDTAGSEGHPAVAAPLRIRVGLNAGEPIAEERDLFGTAVIMASRIAAKARGGEILASNVVRELVAGKGFLFADRGEMVMRGFEDPVRVYEVSWREGE